MEGQRAIALNQHHLAIINMLREKAEHYGEKNGFFDANSKGQYSHALGEAKLKIEEFRKTGNVRMLVKACTWLYLIFETEVTDSGQQTLLLAEHRDTWAEGKLPMSASGVPHLCNWYTTRGYCTLLINHTGDHTL